MPHGAGYETAVREVRFMERGHGVRQPGTTPRPASAILLGRAANDPGSPGSLRGPR